MRYTILIALVCFVFLGCKKDTYSTMPQLTFKSLNTKELQPDQVIKINLSFTDAEGDVVNKLYIQKVSLNCPNSIFTDSVAIPDFPTSKNLKGDILVSYANGANVPPYINIAFGCNVNDTTYFKFVLKDKANHTSDTARSDIFVIVKQ